MTVTDLFLLREVDFRIEIPEAVWYATYEVNDMKLLCIGNSFSQDATRYLHQIAAAGGEEITAVNLYIGGCSLSRHYENMTGDKKEYSFEQNGEATGFFVTLKEALESNDWDAVTLQQVSQESPRFETYEPYLSALCGYVREKAPRAKILIHQTWAYEEGSERLCEEMGYRHQEDMFREAALAYEKAAQTIHADGIIPSGEAFQNLLAMGAQKIHRDTFHASLGLGRYTLGLLWYECLTGKNPEENGFITLDEPISADEIRMAKTAAHAAYLKYKD